MTGDSSLEYASAPRPMTGGQSGAAIYTFELGRPPPALAGPLVFRLPAGTETARRKEAALQDAAGRLGCTVPAVRLVGAPNVGLGGSFFVMERLAGGAVDRWSKTSFGLGLLASVLLWHVWPLVVGYLLGTVAVGLALGRHQHRLHALPLADVRRIYFEHGLDDAEVANDGWLRLIAKIVEEGGLSGCEDGVRWLREQHRAPARRCLCHGDVHPRNLMATWTRVTGLIDWELACIGDPECDVAATRSVLNIELVPWLARLARPLYWSYLAYMRAVEDLDPERLRYYEALRVLLILVHTVRRSVEAGEVTKAHRRFVERHVRRFRVLTGVRLTTERVAEGPDGGAT